MKQHILCINKEETAVDGIAYLECGECGWHCWVSQNDVDLACFDMYQFLGEVHQGNVYYEMCRTERELPHVG